MTYPLINSRGHYEIEHDRLLGASVWNPNHWIGHVKNGTQTHLIAGIGILAHIRCEICTIPTYLLEDIRSNGFFPRDENFIKHDGLFGVHTDGKPLDRGGHIRNRTHLIWAYCPNWHILDAKIWAIIWGGIERTGVFVCISAFAIERQEYVV